MAHIKVPSTESEAMAFEPSSKRHCVFVDNKDNPLMKHLFCGRCGADCGPPPGYHGRWQGVMYDNRRKWCYLCPDCDRDLWAQFTASDPVWQQFIKNELWPES